ncbi:uncharacterized protein FFM5_03123 [Fusarium fujikuroi]|nr:uncharacterized protein FFM5_03123 [Fusarium fujikuroi]
MAFLTVILVSLVL